MFGNYFFKHLLRLVRVGSGGEVISVVYGTDD